MCDLFHMSLETSSACACLCRDIREWCSVSIYSALRLLFIKIDLDLISLSARAKREGSVTGSDKDGRKGKSGQNRRRQEEEQIRVRMTRVRLLRVRREVTFCCPHDVLEAETSGRQNTERQKQLCSFQEVSREGWEWGGGEGFFTEPTPAQTRTHTGVSRAHKGNAPPSLSRVMFFAETHTHTRQKSTGE